MLAGNSKLPAALVAVTAALVTRSVLATIASGLGSMWILDYFLY
jgi:branched-subunit amino acid transport protein